MRVGGGATWGKVDAATNQHGMATPSGIISTTGVGGLTLGGGIGHLARGYGLTIDSLLEAEVVLADGETVTRERRREHRPVLGAARRRRQLRRGHGVHCSALHPVSNGVRRSDVLADRNGRREILRWYREFQPSLPREMTGFFAYLTVPPVPPFPEELHMKQVCGVVWCYNGDAGVVGGAVRRRWWRRSR